LQLLKKLYSSMVEKFGRNLNCEKVQLSISLFLNIELNK
jgi:hypothetical protein